MKHDPWKGTVWMAARHSKRIYRRQIGYFDRREGWTSRWKFLASVKRFFGKLLTDRL